MARREGEQEEEVVERTPDTRSDVFAFIVVSTALVEIVEMDI